MLDLNYGGGAGFAREYRERLKLNWGIVDADDCVNGAKFLAEQGLVDLRRLVISGGSATDEEQVVPGDALCGSCTSRIPSCWINLSSGTVASTLARLVSRGASAEGLRAESWDERWVLLAGRHGRATEDYHSPLHQTDTGVSLRVAGSRIPRLWK